MGMHKGMTGKVGPASVKRDVTLGDYIERKYPEAVKKKLTFDEWYLKVFCLNQDKYWGCYPFINTLRRIWDEAQEQCNCSNEPKGSKENK